MFDKNRMVVIFRPLELLDEIQIAQETKFYWANNTAWAVIKSRWIDKEGVRTIEVGNDTLIVMIDVKKKKK